MSTSFNPFFDALSRFNESLFQMISAQAEQTGRALMETNLEDAEQLLEQSFRHPWQVAEIQMNWWQNQLKLFQSTLLKSAGEQVSPVIEAEPHDRRFRNEQWQLPLFDYIKQSYLLTSKSILDTVEDIPGLSEERRKRLRFFARQYVNAFAPSNFLASNPELLKLTMEKGGENLIRGMSLLLEDMERSTDTLNVRLTQDDAFELGVDLATTPGKVVFRNALFELIQYSATTEQVAKTPILIVPPFINKYYIMDMRPQNSMVKWLVDQGHSVFMMSWKNPTQEDRDLELDHYVTDGVIAALEQIENLTGEKEVHGVGYCIGGTLLSISMAYMAARRQKQRVRSATLFTTIIDFCEPGELGIFIHPPIIAAIEAQNNAKGIMDGRQMAVSFSLLRENSLYWNYYIESYLKGNSPVAFDLLYWNSDNTNVAGKVHNQLLRQLYLENRLIKGEFYIGKTRIDLSKVKAPVMLVSGKEDHIAVWQGTYQGKQAFGGPTRFVLAESGHIAGIINPPSSGKYGYWTLDQEDAQALDPDTWLSQAAHQNGSWWPDWDQWLHQHGRSENVEARPIENALTSAPGEYVRKRLNPVLTLSSENKATANKTATEATQC